MVLQSLAGLPAFLVYFCTAAVIVLLYLWIYTLITPYNEFQLIRDNVPGAAISLGLSLVGFSLPLILGPRPVQRQFIGERHSEPRWLWIFWICVRQREVVMKRSRRVILQWIGTAAIGTVSMGLAPRDCYIRGAPDAPRLARRRLPECEVAYGGFGGTPRYFAPAAHAGG